MPYKLLPRNHQHYLFALVGLTVGLFALTFQLVNAEGTCPLRLSISSQSKSPDALWQGDNLYWVSQTPLAQSRYQVLIVGDTLRLTSADFPMLARTDDRPITNWDKVVFDARKIIIAMPLVFSSSNVEFRAEEIIWEPEGRIALKTAPDSMRPDGVTLTAERIDFSRAPKVAFDFEVDNWQAYPNNDADIDPAKRWRRSLVLRGANVVPPNVLANQDGDPWFWIRDLSRDRWDVLRGGPAGAYSRRPYNLLFGQDATKVYGQSLTSDMLWPTAFASKVQRTFAQTPYDSTNSVFFLTTLRIERYTQLFSDKPRHRWATQGLVDVADAVHRQVDLFGYPAEFVPRVKFDVLRAAFDRQFAKTEALSLKAIEKLLGDPTALAADADRKEQLRELDTKRTSLQTDLRTVQNQGSALTIEIEVLRQNFEAEASNLEAFKKQVEQWARDKQKSDQERQKLQIAIDAIGLAGTTAITVFATPAAGAVFAKTWATAGGTVVKHQSGATITNLQQASEAVKDGLKQGENWSQFSKDALVKWKLLENSGAEGKSVADQVRLAVDVINVVGQQVDAISQRASISSNTGSDFDLDPAWKAQADSLRTKMEQLNQNIADKQLKFAGVAEQMKGILDQLQAMDKLQVALNAEKPSNPSEQSELEVFYDGLITTLTANLSSSYATLSRAYSYYVRTIPAPFDLAPIRDTMYTLQSRQLSALASEGKEAPVITVSGGDQLRKAFVDYDKALVLMDADVIAAYGKVMNGSKFSEVWRYSSDAREDKAKREVVSVIQRELQRLFEDIRRKNGRPNQATTIVALPIYMFLDPSPNTPELLREMFVNKVTFVGPVTRDARIELAVTHPAYGDIYRGTGCYFVNFADPSASENVLKFPAVVNANGSTNFAGPADNVYAPFPLRANYGMEISVRRLRQDADFSEWVVPKVQQIELQSNYIRY